MSPEARAAAPSENGAERAAPPALLLQRAAALGRQNGADVGGRRARLLSTDEVLHKLDLPSASGFTTAVMEAFAAGFEDRSKRGCG